MHKRHAGTFRQGRASALALRGRAPLAVEHCHRVVPEPHIDSNVLADRTDRSRAAGPPRCRATLQTAGDEIFLNDVICQPKRVAEIRIPAGVQQLIGEHRQVRLVIRVADFQRSLGEIPAFPVAELTLRHPLYDAGNVIEAPGDRQRGIDDIMDVVPPVRHMQETKVTNLGYQPVGANGPKQSGAQGVG